MDSTSILLIMRSYLVFLSTCPIIPRKGPAEALPHDESTWGVRIIILVLFFCLLVDVFEDEVEKQKDENITGSHRSPPFSDSFPVDGRRKNRGTKKRGRTEAGSLPNPKDGFTYIVFGRDICSRMFPISNEIKLGSNPDICSILYKTGS